MLLLDIAPGPVDSGGLDITPLIVIILLAVIVAVLVILGLRALRKRRR